jgi:hypothetical protein
MLAVEGSGDRFNQHGERGNAPETPRLPQREDAFDPAIPLGIVGALHDLAPKDGKSQSSLCPVVRGLDLFFHHERPENAQLSFHCPSQCPGLIPSMPMAGQQMDQPRIPGLHLACGRRRMGPVHQALDFHQYPVPKPGQLRLFPLGQAPRPAEQVRQASLPAMDPVLVHAISVAHHNAGPAFNQRLECGLAPARLHLEQGDRRVYLHPQPRQQAVLVPSGLVNVIDRRTARAAGRGSMDWPSGRFAGRRAAKLS